MTVDSGTVLALFCAALFWWMMAALKEAVLEAAKSVRDLDEDLDDKCADIVADLKRIAVATEQLAKAEVGLSEDLRRAAAMKLEPRNL